MTAGFRAYGLVLADPRARAFSAAGFLARLPISMTGIGIVLLVSLTSGSFGRAGLITAVFTVTGAISAPVWGRVIDRVGQAPVLLATAALAASGVAALVTSVLAGWPLLVSVGSAVWLGLGFTSAGACVRARWTHRLASSPLLGTAFAVEAVLDEVVFIVGPVLVTFLATTVHPAAGISVAAGVGLVGAVLLAVQRGTQPPLQPASTQTRRGRMPVRVLAPVVIACAALGAVFGGMEVVVVAFAKEADLLPYAGVLLMCWAAGSLVAGVVTGSVQWRVTAARRFRVGALVLGLTLLPLPFVTHPVLLGAVLAVSGMAIAPTLIASVAVTQAAVEQTRLTEALAWTTTGIAAGVATGAAVLGRLIDAYGAQAGFSGVVAAGVTLVLASLAVRAQRGVDSLPVSPAPAGSRPAGPPPPGVETPLR